MTHSTTRFCALLLSIATIPAVGSTGPQPYAASSIPAELRENAHAVVRESREEFVIYRPDAATYRVQHAVTVLNDNGDRFASLAIYYDKQHKISDVRCEIFDAAGRSVKRVRNKDLTDRSVTSYSLYDDNRLLSYEYQTNNYPYTLVYSYEEDYDGILYCPRWQPVRRLWPVGGAVVLHRIGPRRCALPLPRPPRESNRLDRYCRGNHHHLAGD